MVLQQKGLQLRLLLGGILCGLLLAFSSVTGHAAAMTAEIQSCKILESEKNEVTVDLNTNGDTTGTDGKIYLFELMPYESGLNGRTDYIAQADAGQQVQFQFSLNRGQVDDRLFSAFAAAVKTDQGYELISNRHYITNPELVAGNQDPLKTGIGKKGLNIELSMVNDAMQLGVKHVGINIATHQILGSGISYTYDGKTYEFNRDVIASYDKLVETFSAKDLVVTAIILNGWNPNMPQLYRPGTVQTSQAAYYVFNAETEEGFETTKAIAAFLAERYSGKSGHGKITNWIIGNEINNQYWNYTGPMEARDYVRIYQRAFRVFYTAIKSTSANDNVYFSLDYNWNNPQEYNGSTKYKGKEILDHFNSIAYEEGQMDWGLSYHPYPCPMTEPEFWDDDQTGLLTKDISSPVINFYNLNLLTDYMQDSAMLSPTGEVRHIILTEQGFTSTSATRGEVLQEQAAAFAYSYYLVDSNPYIEAYILSRQVDAPTEVNTGLSFGLYYADMSKPDQIEAYLPKPIYQVFKNIDKRAKTLETTEFAKSIIGIDKWSDVIPNFKWKSME